jgi:hypothetical protein
MDEAQLASDMYRRGHKIKEIKEAIDKKYG